MRSIYESAMGSEFFKLHPKIQERFGFKTSDGVACIGRGVMDEVWHGAPYTLPFLYVGTWRHIMFPERGKNIPFTIANYAFMDECGRENVTWIRTFHTNMTRRFDAYMIYSQQRKKIVDYLGSHKHLAVDIDLDVAPNGGLHLRSGAQRFYEGAVGFDFPMAFSGTADVIEWYDDEKSCYSIKVVVTNSLWGRLFGYTGSFQAEWLKTAAVPSDIMPKREERRE